MKSKLLFFLFFFFAIKSINAQQASMVKDICTSTGAGSTPSALVNVNGMLYFIASCNYYPELWKSDGTDAGTSKVKAFDTPGGLLHLFNMAGTLYFAAETAANGLELWKSDGTETGTVMVKDIYPGKSSSLNKNSFLPAELNGKIYFCATGKGGYDTEPWVSDGTEAGTKRLRDVNPTLNLSGGSFPTRFTTINGSVYFVANDGVNGYELWKNFGADSAVMVKNISPKADAFDITTANDRWKPFVNSNGIFYFSAAQDDLSNNYNLWKSDGTDAGTVKVATTGVAQGITLVNNQLFFFVTEGGPMGLWKSDGVNTASKIKGNLFNISYWIGAKDVLYFTGKDLNDKTDYGAELWKSDGTLAGTVMVKDIVPGTNSSNIHDLFTVDNTLYFGASTTANGDELWSSDGTEAGTSIFADIATGALSSQPQYFTPFNGATYFTAADATHGRELWKLGATIITGLSEKDLSEIEIYPNPVAGNLVVNSTAISGDSELSIINLLGETVFTKTIQNASNNIELSKLENGVYTLKISSAKGNVFKKILINK